MNRNEPILFWACVFFLWLGLVETRRLIPTRKEHSMLLPGSSDLPRQWRRCIQQGHWYHTASTKCPIDFSWLVNATSHPLTRIAALQDNPLIALHFRDEALREAFLRFVLAYEEEHHVLLTALMALEKWQDGQLWTLKQSRWLA